MDIRPIRTDEDHQEALREIERLWSFPDDSPENDKLEVLSVLVEDYEDKRWPMGPTTPRDILEYATTELGRSQTELAELLGSRSQASDLLSGRRRISIRAAQKISTAWNIPIQLLVAPYEAEPAPRQSRRAKNGAPAGRAA
jgi:antitoxin component HigA of HigAB toxin-antitoxin module